MFRSHKIHMRPNKVQAGLLLQAAGTARYVYNDGLAKWDKMWEAWKADHSLPKPNANLLSRIWTKERPEWAKEVAFTVQHNAIIDLGVAFTNFFKNRSKHPTFHKKGIKDSFRIDNDKAAIKGKRIRIPNVGWIKLSEELRFQGKINSYTVSTYAGRWYVSVSVEVPEETRDIPDTAIGIDVGLDNPAWDSDNNHLQLPEKDLEKFGRKLKSVQKALSRSKRNSKNSQKKLLKKQKVQDKINNIRNDVAHKYTTSVCKSHATVVVEDLDIEGMIKDAPTRSIRRGYNTSLMRTVLYQLSYKAKKLIKVPRFYPSSKTCSHCGAIKSELPPKVRIYKCEHCGAVINRDYNAALNLMKIGLVKSE